VDAVLLPNHGNLFIIGGQVHIPDFQAVRATCLEDRPLHQGQPTEGQHILAWQAAATALYTAITVISALRTVMYPFLPFSSRQLSLYLGFSEDVEKDGWKLCHPQSGQQLSEPKPLFTKLDEKTVLKEIAAE